MGVTRRINKLAFQQQKVKSNAVSQASLEFGPSGFVCVPFPFADMFPDEFLAVPCVVVGVPGEMVECVLCAADRWLGGVLGDQPCSPSFHHFEKLARAVY